MIACSHNQLTFEFPDVSAALEAQAARYIETWLPTVTAPDPMKQFHAELDGYDWLTLEQKDAFIRQTSLITREHVTHKFRAMVGRKIAMHRPRVEVRFHRTVRLPDDGRIYPLPPGLDSFPLRAVHDYQYEVPSEWKRSGGVFMPMDQAEALWVGFSGSYPFAVKVSTGLVNAVNGETGSPGLCRQPQGYLVLPEQLRLDGYCAGPGIIRQFVAARLGDNYTAEEQLRGSAGGGLQLEVIPVKPERFFEKQLRDALPRTAEEVVREFASLACVYRSPPSRA